MRKALGTIGPAVALPLLLLCTAAASATSQQSKPPRQSAVSGRSLPPVDRRTLEIVVLAFTSSTCPWAQRDSFRITLERLVSAASAYAASQPVPMRLVVAGAGLDESPEVGLAALRRLGSFDEISVGRGWLNPQAVRFGFRDFKHVIGTPGIVVYRREVTPRSQTIEVSADSVLDRGDGANGILALVDRVQRRSGAFASRRAVASTNPGRIR